MKQEGETHDATTRQPACAAWRGSLQLYLLGRCSSALNIAARSVGQMIGLVVIYQSYVRCARTRPSFAPARVVVARACVRAYNE